VKPPAHLLELASVVKKHAAEAQQRRVVSARERAPRLPARKPSILIFKKKGTR
jgi:hypothetical protein